MSSNEQLGALVRRCQHGERAAFEELFRQFQPRLRYYIRRLTGGDDHTEDTLQDVWVKVVRQICSLRDRKAFVAWLYTIARNEAYGRAKVKDPFLGLPDEDHNLVADDREPAFVVVPGIAGVQTEHCADTPEAPEGLVEDQSFNRICLLAKKPGRSFARPPRMCLRMNSLTQSFISRIQTLRNRTGLP